VSLSLRLKTESGIVSETLCFLFIYNSGQWTKSTIRVTPSVIGHRQNPLHPTCEVRVSEDPSCVYKVKRYSNFSVSTSILNAYSEILLRRT
jgi:hypothetical protein